ncbi:MAG TPA: YggS family pyridoxal phosphate-dependent enzyme [Candidatus Eisenbacteria bacterium]
MNSGLDTLRGRLEDVRARIAAATRRSGRAPGTVRLVAVVKTVSAPAIAEAVAWGAEDLGESRVQEAETHITAVGRHAARWHFIGHLQRNKAARAAELFDRVHGLDSAETARALSVRAATAGRRLPVLLEVNVSGEASKHGVAPEGAAALAAAIGALPGLTLDGLMTVGAPVARPDDARPGFARLRTLRDAIEGSTGLALPELSMGMSADFEAAIAEGSTMVRVGTALFGAR